MSNLLRKRVKCPNCLRTHGVPQEPCMVGALASMLEERGYTRLHALERIAKVNADHLWDDLGPILDNFADGHYDEVPE